MLNYCPKCGFKLSEVLDADANKPASGQIGQAASSGSDLKAPVPAEPKKPSSTGKAIGIIIIMIILAVAAVQIFKAR